MTSQIQTINPKAKIIEILEENIALSQDDLINQIKQEYSNKSNNYFENIINDLILESKIWRTRLENKNNKLFLFIEKSI